jgi:hypothetical protein
VTQEIVTQKERGEFSGDASGYFFFDAILILVTYVPDRCRTRNHSSTPCGFLEWFAEFGSSIEKF